MTRFTVFAFATMLSFTPALASAETPDTTPCSPAEAGAAKLSASGLSCTQWVSRFTPDREAPTQTARNERAAAPHS